MPIALIKFLETEWPRGREVAQPLFLVQVSLIPFKIIYLPLVIPTCRASLPPTFKQSFPYAGGEVTRPVIHSLDGKDLNISYHLFNKLPPV